ncbi:MAG: hypothetical protein [brine shrimp arlivirus 3]|nr:MAG: hypothetical protein [brine shrimp arlivirus 3]
MVFPFYYKKREKQEIAMAEQQDNAPQQQATQQTGAEREQECYNHLRNFICPVPCRFVHPECAVPELKEEEFPAWLNMMLHSLKENQRLLQNQQFLHQRKVDNRLNQIEKQLKIISERISQFSFAQGVYSRPATDLSLRQVNDPPTTSKYSLEIPETFERQMANRTGRNRSRHQWERYPRSHSTTPSSGRYRDGVNPTKDN